VIETVFLDWSLALGAGLFFGLAGRREVETAGSFVRTRAFRWGFVYLQLGVLAISLTLYAIEPAWMWMYWVDPARLPIVAVALVFVLYEVCFVAGFALASELERWRRNATWWVAGGMFVAINAAEIATWRRLFHFGTFAEYQAGKAVLGLDFSPFHLEPAMAIVLGPGVIATVAVVVLALKIWRDNERRSPERKADVAVASAEYTSN
jgi:hypothetical protein